MQSSHDGQELICLELLSKPWLTAELACRQNFAALHVLYLEYISLILFSTTQLNDRVIQGMTWNDI